MVFRALLVLGLVAAAAGTAHARRGTSCPAPEPISELRMTLAAVVPVAAAAPVPAPEPEPPLAPICLPGFNHDPRCSPDDSAPGPTGNKLPLFSELFVLVRPPALGGVSSRSLARLPALTVALAAGHARRIERPPRASLA